MTERAPAHTHAHTHTHTQVMSEHSRLSTIVEEVIATSQGTSFYVQTEPQGEGAGTFLTQDEGGKSFAFSRVPWSGHSHILDTTSR